MITRIAKYKTGIQISSHKKIIIIVFYNKNNIFKKVTITKNQTNNFKKDLQDFLMLKSRIHTKNNDLICIFISNIINCVNI